MSEPAPLPMNNDPQDVVLLDGGTGMELLRRSSDKTPRLWSAQYLLSEPDLVRAVHRDYIHAGARVITINAYSASYTRMEMVGETERVPLMQRRACELALRARDDAGATGAQVKIAGCLPPLNGSYRPDRVRDFETNRAEYERLAALQAPHVDLFLCETLSSADEARAAVSAVAGLGKPVWVAFTLQDEGPALRSGESVDEAVQALSGLGVAAVLVNCCPPEAITLAMPALVAQGLPAGGYANGFTQIPKAFMPGKTRLMLRSREDLDPAAYAEHALGWWRAGARLLGGCCEVGPEHIAHLHQRLTDSGARVVTELA